MFKTYIIPVITFSLAIALLPGCNKLVEIDPPLNEMSSERVFKSDNTAKSTLSGLYSLLSQSQAQVIQLTLFPALGSDELELLPASVTYEDVRNNTMQATSSNASGFFNDLYASVYRANSIIEGLQKYTGTSAAVKKQLTGEAKFIRAYCYFYLVNLFGKVPLVLETDVTKTAYLPRTSVDSVYDQIIKDLTDAKDSLPADYSASSGNRTNANKYAATALLARAYLYTGNYTAAESNATEVINATSLYSLIPAASMGTGVFIKNSAEAILQFMPYLNATNSYTAEGATFVTTTSQYSLRTTYVNAFEAGDLRRLKWINEVTLNGVVNYQPYKYKYRTNALAVAAGVTEYPMVLRLAEQYLIRAEARANTDNSTGALADLKVIRNRAGLAESTTTDKAALLLEIEKERQTELFCELGHRWFDLKRTGRSDAVIGAIKTTWNSTDALYPIPQTARDANPNLSQNDGYN
ncbi:RagB/SusD family nutrient uptake outer membrane protein [Pseudoflavitalea sp. X16]|uniref:RagB/SusD family nutrient uptake outer membrane protein n=1 Tax=Paraflavitalea devenefica TaxID=2716334 RepID=UPI00142427A1|nr:RagB/SusD family nutrient uptake outer membrane protein [Paraflavitalea devenefica]NII28485.1 RagB/SusD family nutrient uptake outer membrane protein [Paraflavitalea devenefica]